MRKDLDISLVRAFLTVIEAGGVTRAAAALGVSQAAASQQIKRLEQALDCRLFERQGRQLVLAPAGERLLAQARRLLALNDEVWSSMRTPSFEGEVRLGVPYDIIASFVPAILRRFAKAQPRVRVSLVCEDSKVVREALRSGGVDVALTTEIDCGRHGETLRTDRLVWVGVPGGDAHLKDSVAGVARRADVRVPSRRGRGAGQSAPRLARGVRGESHGAGLRRDRGGACGRAVAALLGARALRGAGPRSAAAGPAR